MRNNSPTRLILVSALALILGLIIFQSDKFLRFKYRKTERSHVMSGVVPDFQFYDLSNNLITNNLFFKGRSLVIMHINTDCDMCSSKVKSLLKYIHEVEGADIVLSSSEDKNTLKTFHELNNLKNYPQIHLVQSESDFFYKNFGSSFIPLVLVFNHEGLLVKKIDDTVPIGTIIKYIKIANNEGSK